jgi:hypothetical protein
MLRADELRSGRLCLHAGMQRADGVDWLRCNIHAKRVRGQDHRSTMFTNTQNFQSADVQ